MPAWSACSVHVPVVTRVTLVPLTVHTLVVSDENVTVRPEDAVAETVTGDCTSVVLPIAGKVIVCAAFVTLKLCCTLGAGL